MPKPRDDGHGFGVVTADLNDDGLIDLYVANDMNPNFLFLNRGDGTFDDATDSRAPPTTINGQAQSGMGVDAEDVDGDGLPELFVTNFANEYNTLYQNLGKGVFYRQHGVLRPGRRHDAVGRLGVLALADFDNDGWPDCFVANGHVDNNRKELGQPVEYEEIPAARSATTRGSGSGWRPATPGRTSTPSTSAGARRSATSTTTATSTSSSTTRTARPPCSATTPSRRTTGSGSSSRAPGATATPSAPSSRSPSRTGSSDPARERTIYRQRKGGYSLAGHERPAGARGRRARRPRSRRSSSAGPRGSSARWRTSRSTASTRSSSPRTASPSPTGRSRRRRPTPRSDGAQDDHPEHQGGGSCEPDGSCWRACVLGSRSRGAIGQRVGWGGVGTTLRPEILRPARPRRAGQDLRRRSGRPDARRRQADRLVGRRAAGQAARGPRQGTVRGGLAPHRQGLLPRRHGPPARVAAGGLPAGARVLPGGAGQGRSGRAMAGRRHRGPLPHESRPAPAVRHPVPLRRAGSSRCGSTRSAPA